MLLLNAVTPKVRDCMTDSEVEMLVHSVKTAPLLKRTYVNVDGTIHWFILDAPFKLRGRHYGTANSLEEADSKIAYLLESLTKQRVSA